MTYNPTLKNLGTTFAGIGKNRVINGEMSIDQANTGSAITTNSSGSTYSVDQFVTRGTASEGVFTTQRVSATPPTGFKFYVRNTTTTASASPAAGSRYLFRQPIEQLNLKDFLQGTASAKSFTLSFWVRSSLTGTFSFSFGGDDGGAGRFYIGNYTINSANTWEYKTITASGDTAIATWPATSSSIFWLYWDMGCGSTFETTAGSWTSSEKYRTSGSTRLISTNAATWDITGVQMELGSAATPFEYRPFPIEVFLCQRYYEKSYELETAPGTDTSTSATAVTGATQGSPDVKSTIIMFKSPKRVSPTMTTWSFATAVSGQARWVSSAGVATNRNTNTYIQYINGFGIEQAITNSDIFATCHWVGDARL